MNKIYTLEEDGEPDCAEACVHMSSIASHDSMLLKTRDELAAVCTIWTLCVNARKEQRDCDCGLDCAATEK
jgi:hypothetical protein